jgi:hypothetical protein
MQVVGHGSGVNHGDHLLSILELHLLKHLLLLLLLQVLLSYLLMRLYQSALYVLLHLLVVTLTDLIELLWDSWVV